MRFLKWLVGLVLLATAGLVIWLAVAPPDLIRVGAQYSAKIVCSNVFLAGRDPEEVLKVDVQAPGHPLLRIMGVDVDHQQGTVRAGLFGRFGNGLSIYREGIGCTTIAGGEPGDVAPVDAPAKMMPPSPGQLWPAGNKVQPAANKQLDAVLDDPVLTGEGMRAIVVVKDGRIIAERYSEGFTPETPLLGWSMTKTVTAALVGLRIGEGKLALDQTITTFPDWLKDDRKDITLADLMGMVSDLEWNENYGDVSDVTRMLYLEPDMSAFVASMPIDTVSPEGIGESFEYSTGTTILLSEILQSVAGKPEAALSFATDALFQPLGMAGATLEADQSGTPASGSYMYAPARDWARFGLLLLQKGQWQGRSLLPSGFVDWMTELNPASDGFYGRGQIWRKPQNYARPGPNVELPDDGFYMGGHDGQSVSIIPSQDLVVVRMGLTPSKRGYKVATLVDAVIRATLK